NGSSQALHGFLTRDGTDPHEVLRIAREQLRAYDNVEVRSAAVRDAARERAGFRVTLENGVKYQARKLLLATGVVDDLPASEGIELRDEEIECLEGRDGQLERILFADGTHLVRQAMFFAPAWKQHSGLAVRLGSRLNEHGLVTARRDGSTEVPGLFVAGDA